MSTALTASTADGRIVDGFTSLIDSVDSEDIAERYDIGIHSKRIDFLEHVKLGLRMGWRIQTRSKISLNSPMCVPTSNRSVRVTSRN
jgi:hypothetical protein